MKDLTQGNEGKQIFLLAVPMFLSNIVQQLYGLADGIVVGRALGTDAFAAVGNSFFVMTLLIMLIFAACMGFSVLISQAYGAKDQPRLLSSIQALMTLSVAAGVLFTILGIWLTPQILWLLNTPEEVFGLSQTYLRIVFAGTVGVFGYNAISTAFRGLGDTKTPLMLLIFCTLLNLGLDLLFVLVLPWGVAGAAIATVIAECLSFIAGTLWFVKKFPGKLFSLRLDKAIIKAGTKIGLPNAIQQISQIATMFVMRIIINGFGVAPMAAYNAVVKINDITQYPLMGFGGAMAVFVAQNIGADRYDRVHRGYVQGTFINMAQAVVISVMMIFAHRWFISLFLPQAGASDVLYYASGYYNIIAYFYVVLSLLNVVWGTLSGAGATLVILITSLVSFAGVQMTLFVLISRWTNNINDVWWALPIAWAIGAIILRIYYATGKWKKKMLA